MSEDSQKDGSKENCFIFLLFWGIFLRMKVTLAIARQLLV